MPFKRGYRRRYFRRRTKFRSRRKRRYTVKRRIRRIERKTAGIQVKRGISVSSGPVTITDAGSIFTLNNIPIGTDNASRIGNDTTPIRLSVRMQCFITNAVSATLRIIVFTVKNVSGRSASAIKDSIFGVGSTGVNLYKSSDTRFNSKFHRDVVVSVQNETIRQRTVKFNIPLKMQSSYDASDATGGTIERGGIYMMVYSNVPVVDPPRVEFATLLSYYDA